MVFIEHKNHRHETSKSLYLGVTITIGYACYNMGKITKLISPTHTCTNRKVGYSIPQQNIVKQNKMG